MLSDFCNSDMCWLHCWW